MLPPEEGGDTKGGVSTDTDADESTGMMHTPIPSPPPPASPPPSPSFDFGEVDDTKPSSATPSGGQSAAGASGDPQVQFGGGPGGSSLSDADTHHDGMPPSQGSPDDTDPGAQTDAGIDTDPGK